MAIQGGTQTPSPSPAPQPTGYFKPLSTNPGANPSNPINGQQGPPSFSTPNQQQPASWVTQLMSGLGLNNLPNSNNISQFFTDWGQIENGPQANPLNAMAPGGGLITDPTQAMQQYLANFGGSDSIIVNDLKSGAYDSAAQAIGPGGPLGSGAWDTSDENDTNFLLGAFPNDAPSSADPNPTVQGLAGITQQAAAQNAASGTQIGDLQGQLGITQQMEALQQQQAQQEAGWQLSGLNLQQQGLGNQQAYLNAQQAAAAQQQQYQDVGFGIQSQNIESQNQLAQAGFATQTAERNSQWGATQQNYDLTKQDIAAQQQLLGTTEGIAGQQFDTSNKQRQLNELQQYQGLQDSAAAGGSTYTPGYGRSVSQLEQGAGLAQDQANLQYGQQQAQFGYQGGSLQRTGQRADIGENLAAATNWYNTLYQNAQQQAQQNQYQSSRQGLYLSGLESNTQYGLQQAGFNYQNSALGLAGQQLGLSQQEVSGRLTDALQQMGLSSSLTADQIGQAIDQLRAGQYTPLSAIATQVLQMTGLYAPLFGG